MSSHSGSSMGPIEWIIVLLVVAGCLGLGPCANSCYCGGPKIIVENK